MENLAQSDPYYIPEASRDGRLFLVRSKGPLSGGTQVTMVRCDHNYRNLTVMSANGIKVVVENRDLVIRKKAA